MGPSGEDGPLTPLPRALLIGKIGELPVNGPDDYREIITMLQRIEREVRTLERTEFLLQIPDADDPALFRRAAEACVLGSETKVELCKNGRSRKKREERTGAERPRPESKKKGKNREKKKEEEESHEVIVVKPQEGETFADIARALKSRVSPEEEGVTIQRISNDNAN